MFSLFGGKKNTIENPITVYSKKPTTKHNIKNIDFKESDIKFLNKMLIILIDNKSNLNIDDKTIKKINNIQKIINN